MCGRACRTAHRLDCRAAIHHVGLYIGKGKMVHAPYTGSHVQIAPMSRSDYAGAVRPS
ncbi:C40 family peptidase [Microbispora sp. NEAU-D428]|nr:C40 family peptidase [Microbispora sitophila]